MGPGVAKAIRDKYPQAYRDYNDKYNDAGFDLGTIVVSVQDDGKVIHNAITQQDYGRDQNRVYVSYWAIANVFRYIDSWGIKCIAMPKIGSGLAGGNWKVIASIIETRLQKLNLLFMYWKNDMYKICYIEQSQTGLWYIMWPDCTRAWQQGYRTKGWASRILNRLNK